MRQPAVAGTFYPAEPAALRARVEGYLQAARPPACRPAALIVPHAGYRYSGAVAAAGYACLPAERRAAVRRVILLGTAHLRGSEGLIATRSEGFLTPLGPVAVDRQAVESALGLPWVACGEEGHARDHALEVQLPFLQVLLPDFALVPFLVGRTPPAAVARVLERLWQPGETLLVVSSDLSHYHDAESARRIDRGAAEAILALRGEGVGPEQACGCHAIRGLLRFARRRAWRPLLVEMANSGDVSGERGRVVGYGAFAFEEAEQR